MKLKKGDKVTIITGKDKGRDGVIDRVYKKSRKVLIQGINIYKKHVKKSEQMPQGGVVELPRPILACKVKLSNAVEKAEENVKIDKTEKKSEKKSKQVSK
ncbi:MAG: 50S ribosomal protein L24 [Candidatus Roizmanbacteria bacterium]